MLMEVEVGDEAEACWGGATGATETMRKKVTHSDIRKHVREILHKCIK